MCGRGYLIPSSETYFSVVSFCLIFCVSNLHSAGCRIIIPLASGVCPLVDEAHPGTCAGFLVGETGASKLVSGARSFPLAGLCRGV